jgi:hypothetical protein
MSFSTIWAIARLLGGSRRSVTWCWSYRAGRRCPLWVISGHGAPFVSDFGPQHAVPLALQSFRVAPFLETDYDFPQRGLNCHAPTGATKRDLVSDLCHRSSYRTVGRRCTAHRGSSRRPFHGHLPQRNICTCRTGTRPRPARAGPRVRSLQSMQHRRTTASPRYGGDCSLRASADIAGTAPGQYRAA